MYVYICQSITLEPIFRKHWIFRQLLATLAPVAKVLSFNRIHWQPLPNYTVTVERLFWQHMCNLATVAKLYLNGRRAILATHVYFGYRCQTILQNDHSGNTSTVNLNNITWKFNDFLLQYKNNSKKRNINMEESRQNWHIILFVDNIS